PCLMNEGSMSRVHESDDGMIHCATKALAFHELRTGVALEGNFGGLEWWLSELLSRRRHEYPDKAVLLAQWIGAHANARGIDVLTVHERGYGHAGALGPEAPSVIRTLDRVFFKQSAGRKGYPAVGADITQPEGMSV